MNYFVSSSCCYGCCGIMKFNYPETRRIPCLILTTTRRNIIASSSTRRFDKTITTTTRRRRNHLRKKIQQQVPSPLTTSVENNYVVVDKEESSSSSFSSNNNTISSSVVLNSVLEEEEVNHNEILTSTNPLYFLNFNFNSFPKLSVLSSFLLFIAAAASFIAKQNNNQHSSSSSTSSSSSLVDNEMLRRKFKARMAKHHTIIQDSPPPPAPAPQMQMTPPQLDKQHLIHTIHSSSHPNIHQTSSTSFNNHQTSPRIITSVNEARQYLSNKKLHSDSNTQLPNIINPKDTTNENLSINKPTANANPRKEELHRANRQKWVDDNFHEFQPIVDKIRAGFTNNYTLAKHKVKEDLHDIVSDLKMLHHDQTETEFEWMKDEKLREVVFQVRENELMGRDPFYLMDHQDKALFFKGLENNVEKENQKLRNLHEYLHSNIENLDYGADGISLYDPPEKIIPRWKGPPPATTISQEFLDDYLHQRKSLFAETLGNSDLTKTDPRDSLQSTDKTVESKNLKSSKTVIEGSDGSVKPGKKSGKEFWQHTKKWSRGFLDSYNAENDPETKAAMKDIGKDLDRWITEKEIQAAADIMDKVPDKGKKFIAEKINKLKTEMELFGPQAVVSKYSEYGEEEEIDYYWWLDLPFLLCIELYIDGNEEERIGFYSLEMASDLELDPKPHHIIAFEDAGDCKNFCYIIQAHMEMLGNGNAFVVPQLPKDTYQEAKTNGFNVTVIRKGELKLDVDQTLEEVEEKLEEIGSKMYHDKIMKGRNVDVDSVMKGVFGLNKPSKRSRSKKKLKKPTK